MSSSTFHRRATTKVKYTSFDFPDETFSTNDAPIVRQDTVFRDPGLKNWRKIIAEGGNATTNMSGTRWNFAQTPANLQASINAIQSPAYYDSQTTVVGNILPTSVPGTYPTLLLSSFHAQNLALTRYYQNLAGIHSRFQGGVLSGELRETLSMIRHPAKAFRNGIGHYLGFLRKNAGRVAKRQRPSFIRKTWLEYSFGWKPLINDCDSAIQAFYQSKWAHPIFEMVKGTARDRMQQITEQAISINIGAGHYIKGAHRAEEECYTKYFGIYRSDGRGIPDSHAYGFSPWEFVPTLYELLPYSFLVDYFSNIGGILSSWSYRWLQNGWIARTNRRTYTHQCVNVKVVPDPGFSPSFNRFKSSGDPGTASYVVVSFDRVPNVSLDLPSLELRVPGKWYQWVNIVALTAGHDAARKALAR